MIAWTGRAGGGLWARRYLGVTSGQECGGRAAAGLLWCSPGKSGGPFCWGPRCCFLTLFSFPSLALGQGARHRNLLRRAGGLPVAFRPLAEKLSTPRCAPGILWGGFPCPTCAVVSGRSAGALLVAVPEPQDPGAPGSTSLSRLGPRQVRQAGAKHPACLGWVCARGGVCMAPALWGAGSFPWGWSQTPQRLWAMPGGEGGLGEGQEDGGQVWGVPRRVSASRGFSSVSSPCRRPRAGSDPAQVPAWQCRPG